MRPFAVVALVVVLVMLVVAQAGAACRWEWDCSRGYPCRQVQVCERSYDVPAIRPPEISPIPAPSIRPITPPTVPPIGTTQCQQTYLCDARGRCAWQTVCR